MRVTILGCGTSAGVPRPGGRGGKGEWGACNPADPRNRRRRCSILVQDQGKTVLVDTSPDVRAQMLDAEVERIDAVVWTHEHADQVHGIDDLRPFMLRQGRIESWANQRTYDALFRRFDYCFHMEGNFYAPVYSVNVIQGAFSAGGLPILPIEQDHGTMPSLGLRFGAFGYANDLVTMPESSVDAFKGVEVLVVDAMRYKPHPTHAHLERALEWVEQIGAKRAFLTNLHVDMDYAEVDKVTPDHVHPCHDGLIIDI